MEMIAIARAPLCIHLGGDPHDLLDRSDKAGGLFMTAATSYYAYAIVTPSQLGGVQITYGGQQAFSKSVELAAYIDPSELGLLAAIAHYFDIADGQRVFVASQVPPAFGAAARASLAVAMIKVLAFRCGLDLDPRAVAELACSIDREGPGASAAGTCTIGGQANAYAAAFGGLNCITSSGDTFAVRPLRVTSKTRERLERRLMLFAIECEVPELWASDPAVRFEVPDKQAAKHVQASAQLSLEIRAALEKGNLDAFGRLFCLDGAYADACPEGSVFFDRCCHVAREHGALGGRMTGSGSGRFLLFYCPEDCQASVTQALASLGLCRWPLTLEEEGVQIMQMVPWMWSSGVPPVPWPQPPVTQQAVRTNGPASEPVVEAGGP